MNRTNGVSCETTLRRLPQRERWTAIRTRLAPAAGALLALAGWVGADEPAADSMQDYRVPLVTAPYAATPPTIDGVIDETEWQAAISVNALQTTSKLISPRQTRFWTMWDEDHLYVAMRSPLRDGERIVRNLRDTTRPINVVFDDSYEIWVNVGSSSPDGQPVFFQYLANYPGARYDVMHEPAVGNSRLGWTANWTVKNRVTGDNVWEMEAAIPRASLYRETPFADGEEITMLIARNFKRPWEQNSFEGTSSFSVSDSHTRVVLSKSAPAVHLLRAADPEARTFGLELAAFSPTATRLAWQFESENGVRQHGEFELAAGRLTMAPDTSLAFEQEAQGREPDRFRIRVTGTDGTTLLDWASTRRFGNLASLTLPRPDSDDRIGITLSLNPIDDYVRVRGDFIDYRHRDKVDRCRVAVTNADGDLLAEDAFEIDDLQYARGIIRLPGLPEGAYTVTMRVLADDATVMREVAQTVEKRDPAQVYPWWNTPVGSLDKVLDPWTPVRVDQAAIDVWGRTMQVGAAGLPGQIQSQGHDLLRAPARLVATLPGGTRVEAVPTGLNVVSAEDHRAVLETRAQLDTLAVSSRVTAEFDGMLKIEMTLDPREPLPIEALQIELPLAKPIADYVIGIGEGIRYGYFIGFLPREETGRIWDSYKVDSQPMVVGSFIPYVWVGNTEAGLAWFADSDQGWVPGDAAPAIELIRRDDGQVDWVFNLVAETFTLDAPRTVVFAFQASPARALTNDWRMCTWWCGDTFDWGGGGWVYPDGKGSTIWQSRPNTTNIELCREHALKRQAQKLHFLPPDGPVRRPNVVPYFEYNTMADAGEQHYFGEAWKAASGPLWYGRSLTDYIVWNLDDWVKSSGIDGWYLDNVRPVYCDNIDAGRGYRLPDGRIQPEFNMFIMREFFLRLRAVWQENGRPSKIVNHMTNCMILPWNAPVDVAYDGEHHVIYPEMEKTFMDFWSLERLRMIVPGTWGVNVNFMEEYQGRWDPEAHASAMRAFKGAVILHDALPTGNALWRPATRNLMAARDRFGIDAGDVRFIGYWVNDAGLACPTPDVYLAAWQRPGRLLLAAVNWAETTEADVHVDLDRFGLPAGARVVDAETPDIAFDWAVPGRLRVPVGRHDYRLLLIESPAITP